MTLSPQPIRRLFSRLQRTSWLLLLLVSAIVVPPGCASHGTPPRFPGAIRPPAPAPAPPTPAAPAAPAAPAPAPIPVPAAAIVETALHLEGTPYRNGGASPSTGFDCSGLVQYVFAQHGIALPRAAREQFQSGLAIPRAALVEGDLVFFAIGGAGASHVGIIVDAKEKTFVHAPSGGGVVRVDRLDADYWTRRYVGARRILF